MNKQLLLALMLISFSALFGQTKAKNSTYITILVNDIPRIAKEMDLLISENNIKPWKYTKEKYEVAMVIYANNETYEKVLSAVKNWGYISSEITTMSSFEAEVSKIKSENEGLEKEEQEYLRLANHSDSTQSGNYYAYREKAIALQKTITENERKIAEFRNGEKINHISVSVKEEINSTMEYSSSWVNMPGIEYSHLWVEQPKAGITPNVMQGISLKYMFNTGKSYGILGLYKNYGAKTQVNEAYTFAFGQDFYSRRMGRGQRKFFNLYTSFNAGVYVLSGEESRSASWFINPYLGLEIFKNKYFLIDNKVGYFLPYRDNRDMRGLLYNISFNFVF